MRLLFPIVRAVLRASARATGGHSAAAHPHVAALHPYLDHRTTASTQAAGIEGRAGLSGPLLVTTGGRMRPSQRRKLVRRLAHAAAITEWTTPALPSAWRWRRSMRSEPSPGPASQPWNSTQRVNDTPPQRNCPQRFDPEGAAGRADARQRAHDQAGRRALFLCPKTIEYHLRHVYMKLGISSRAELAGRLDARS
jgi:hypothetical protein